MKADINKTLSARDFLYDEGYGFDPGMDERLIKTLDEFANLRVEQAKEEWEKEKLELESQIERLNDAILGF